MTDNIVSDNINSDVAKTRDFATVTGFMIIFIFSVLIIGCNYKEITIDTLIGTSRTLLFTVLFLVLIFAAGVLAYTKGRYIVAATFILFAFSILAPIVPSEIFGSKEDLLFTTAPMGVAMIVFALAIATSYRMQEIVCILILLLTGTSLITLGFMETYDLKWVIIALEVGVALLSGLTMACFAVRSPKDKIYLFFSGNPEQTHDFRESGMAVGTIIMTMSMIGSSMYYLGIGDISPNEMAALETTAGITLILISVIMAISTNSKFTPFLFLMIGVTFTLTSFVTEIGQVLCIFTLVIGIICFLRNDGKNIIGAAIIIYGFSYLISAQFTDSTNGVLSAVLNIVPMLLLMYLTFAYYSRRRLPIA